jgi:autotransporter passenger strand-loop-strand repeat protein
VASSTLTNATSTGSTVSSGDTLTVSIGGIAIDTTIAADGTIDALNGGIIDSSTVFSEGVETISFGGTADGSVLDGGSLNITQGGTADATQVGAGGIMTTSSGGIANAATIANSGVDYIFNGGSVTTTTVQGGGEEIMFGGVATGSVLGPDGTQEIEAAGAVASATIDDGFQYILNGGVAIGSAVGNGGFDLVESAGAVMSTIVESGGSEFVDNGGTAIATTVDDGGTQFINAGGVASQTLLLTGGALDVTGLDYATGGTATVDATGLLTVSVGGTTYTQRLAAGDIGGTFSLAPDATTGTEVIATSTALCFLAGTRIATPRGQIAVEKLVPGDMVRCANGSLRPITWLGRGNVLATPFRRNAATPIIVRKNALADGIPYDDLRVTKGHSFYFDGVLIPAEFLVNHRSIQWDDWAQKVVLYHIELDRHDILLANGAPAESYRDDGNRWLFENGNSGWDQPAKPSCAPVLTHGSVVDVVWRDLLLRSGPRPGVPLTGDPDLHLMVNQQRIDGVSLTRRIAAFRLPGPPNEVRIVSRAASPQELGLSRDPRVLGVALRRIAIDGGNHCRIIEAHDPSLSVGVHDFEPDGCVRWTNGDAVLPNALFAGFDGPFDVRLHYVKAAHYIDEGRFRRAA